MTGAAKIRHRTGILVALTEGGRTGWGEASPLPGWSRSNITETVKALCQARNIINAARANTDSASATNVDCTSVASVIADISGFPHARAASSPYARVSDSPHARAGLAGAWADLQAKQKSQPLAMNLVGQSAVIFSSHATPAATDLVSQTASHAAGHSGQIRADLTSSAVDVMSDVAVNALITSDDPACVERQACDAVQAGFGTVKLKVGFTDTVSDIRRVYAARSGLGAKPKLRLDANGAWDHATAVDVLKRVEPSEVEFCEEPVSGLSAIAAVRESVGIPVAVDESMGSVADAERALNAGVQFLVVKPQALGGPDVALKIAAAAYETGAVVVVTSFMDTAIGVAHALHVAAATDSLSVTSDTVVAHGLATGDLFIADVASSVPIQNGFMSIPQAAGIGVAPNFDVNSSVGAVPDVVVVCG